MRTTLYEAAQNMLVAFNKMVLLKAWAMKIHRHRGMKRAIVALARRPARKDADLRGPSRAAVTQPAQPRPKVQVVIEKMPEPIFSGSGGRRSVALRCQAFLVPSCPGGRYAQMRDSASRHKDRLAQSIG